MLDSCGDPDDCVPKRYTVLDSLLSLLRRFFCMPVTEVDVTSLFSEGIASLG